MVRWYVRSPTPRTILPVVSDTSLTCTFGAEKAEKSRNQPRAATVWCMTRCRADGFYLTPRDHRKFAEWDVYTKVKGSWTRITHRKDVERLDLDVTWDKICYVSWGKGHRDPDGNPIPMDKRINDDPRDIELWKLDKKLVNGKRSGTGHHIDTIARKGAVRAGGVEAAVGSILGKESVGKLVARWLKTAKLEPTKEATALQLLSMAKDLLDPASLESLASKMADQNTPVPIVNFAATAERNLDFLERYPMQRRVTLLLDLWKEQDLTATGTSIRVALETMDRGGMAREKSVKFIKNLAENHSEIVAKLTAKDPWWVEGSSILYGEKVRAILDGNRATAAICAFHPDNTDPSEALRIVRNRKFLEEKHINLFEKKTLNPQVAKVLREELEKTANIKQTHSPNKCYNLLKLAAAICEVDPCAGDLLVQAYAAWSKTFEASDRWSQSDLDTAFRGRKIRLDALTVEKLYKIQTELLRKSLGYPENRGETKIGDDADCISTELVKVLESQQDVPFGILEQCRKHLDRKGLYYVSEEGVRVSWGDFIRQSKNLAKDLPLVLDRCAGEPSAENRISAYCATFARAASLPMSDEEYDRIRNLCLEGPLDTDSKRDSLVGANACKIMDEVRNGATGKLVIQSGTTYDYGNPAHRTLEAYAQTTTKEQRKWLIEQTGDMDVIYAGWLTTGECDLVNTSGHMDDMARKIQTSILLSGVDGVAWPEKPKKWKDLPTVDYIPWLLPGIYKNLDGKSIVLGGENYDVRVIKNIESLVANAAPNCMGNCTDGYARNIRKGTSLILAVGRGGKTEINVNVHLTRDRSHPDSMAPGEPVWAVGEIKGPSNKALEPAREEAVSVQISALLA